MSLLKFQLELDTSLKPNWTPLISHKTYCSGLKINKFTHEQ